MKFAVNMWLFVLVSCVYLCSCYPQKTNRVDLPIGYEYFIANSNAVGIVYGTRKEYVVPPHVTRVDVTVDKIFGLYEPYKGHLVDWAQPGCFEIKLKTNVVKFAANDLCHTAGN